jgi:hypothetical protein
VSAIASEAEGRDYELAFYKANEACSVREIEIDRLRAVLAAVEALAEDIDRQSRICNVGNSATIAARLRAALSGESA